MLVVDSVVELFQSKGGEMGEHDDEYFVGNLEYWGVVVRLKPNEPHRGEGGRALLGLGLVWVTRALLQQESLHSQLMKENRLPNRRS